MKRQKNTTGLKVKYIGATDTKDSRIKFTQLNNNKSVTVSYNHKFDVLGLTEEILNRIELIKAFSVIIDYSQNNYYLINLEFTGNSFEDITPLIKEISNSLQKITL